MTRNDTDNILTESKSDRASNTTSDLIVMSINHRLFPDKALVEKYHINILCRKGMAHFSVEDKFYQIGPSDYVAWSVDMNVSEIWFSQDFDGEALLTTRNFLLENNPESSWATKGYLFIKESPVTTLRQVDFQRLESDMLLMKQRLDDNENVFCREILGKYLQIYLLDLWNICKFEMSRGDNINNNTSGLFTRFLNLVQQEALEHREVAYYADKLCVTPKYLSEISRRASGKAALYWINGYSIQAIILLLRQSMMTISEISEKAHFYSPSHFSRYFKKLIGVSPTEYRLDIEKRIRIKK